MTSGQDSDTRREKNYFLLGIIFLLVAFIPFAGVIFTVLGAVFWYKAFTGYREKIGFEKPLHYFKPFIVSLVVAIFFITAFIVEKITYSNLLPQNVLAYVGIAAVAVETYCYAHILESFGNHFDIDEFRTAKLFAYVTVYGLPLWLFLSMPAFFSIGTLIILGLVAAFFAYLFMGISKLPTEKDSKEVVEQFSVAG